MNEHQNQREALFAALSDGTIDPKDAEAKAAALGLEPLTKPLDVARYDPMRVPHWTLAMTLAWIVWRTPEAVRELMPAWRRDHYDWYWREHMIGDGAGGYEIRAGWLWEPVHKGEAPMLYLCLAEASAASGGEWPDGSARFTVYDARHALWEKLGAEEIQASTVLNGTPHVMPSHEWPFLELIEHRGRDVLRAGRDMFALALTYDANEILLRRDDVLRLWPAPTPTAADETSAEKELRALVASGALPKSGEWQAKAKAKIGTRGAQRVWGKVAKDYPALGSPAGKPKARRDGASGSKARRRVNP